MELGYSGKFTAGYYNAMEAGHPVFIDGIPVSNIIKDVLQDNGLDPEFCYTPFDKDKEDSVKNLLIGKKVTLILQIED